MENVFIKTKELNEWIAKYFPNKDLISIEDMLAVIEELDEEIERLNEEKEQSYAEEPDEYKILRDMQ